MPSSIADSTNHIADSELERQPEGSSARDAVGAAVVMVNILVIMPEFGVTETGLNIHPASAGSPLHEKLIALLKEAGGDTGWGLTVSVNVPECPAIIVAPVGLEVNVKSTPWPRK